MKKAIGMFAALMVALAMTGVAFAHWAETLKINGKVETGELDAEWVAGKSWDEEPPEKNVSSIRCWVDEKDPRKLWVEVKNAYPCITYSQEIGIHNCGTIPLHIYDIEVKAPPEIEVCIPNWQSKQVHPCETAWGILEVHVKQEASENTTYTFTVEVEVVQWNWPWDED